MAPEGAEMVQFVVRDGDRWLMAPVPGATPVDAGLDGVIAAVRGAGPGLLGAAGLVAPPGDPSPAPSLAADDVVGPVWSWVGVVATDGVVIEGNDGVTITLDRDDLRVLDALVEPTTIGALVAVTGVTEAGARLSRLVAAGRVRRFDGPVEAPVPPAASPEPEPPAVARPPLTGAGDGRVPVVGVWQEQVGPLLSLGMLTAAARRWEGGALDEVYDILPPVTAGEALALLGAGRGPAVLLCSNYVWSLEENLALARRAKALRPELVVVHGGPSTPKYEGDAERFFVEHGDVADVLVRGEGEVVLCRVLEVLAGSLPGLDVDALAGVPGISFRDGEGRVVRTGAPERIPDLDELPSPYLTGEFDHIDPEAWVYAASVESNRGCPYGCTFCDWGSATLSRIRKFDLERVLAEIRWAADRGVAAIQFCDANFGILPRDVDIARGVAAIRRKSGRPGVLSFTPAKNTTRHVGPIFDAVIDAGILVSSAISLQTTDEVTLAAVERSNISTDGYLALAAELRRRGLPLTGDLLIGLPGQTYESYKADLQFFIDHQISPRSWSLRTLPNAPMNAPEYRERFAVHTDGDRIVTSTSTMTAEDRRRMLALRKIQVIADQYGLLTHVTRYLQWDHGIPTTTVFDRLVDLTAGRPQRHPLLSWVFSYFDLHPTVAVGWTAFYRDLGAFLLDEFGVPADDPGLATALQVQVALMPAPERTFPVTVELAHDYPAYYREATAELYTTGRAAEPSRPLTDHPPTVLEVIGDPIGLCTAGLRFGGDSRDESMLGQFWIGVGSSYELLSTFTRVSPAFRNLEIAEQVADGAPSPLLSVAGRRGRPE